jgi:PAS domain S-box-containing protein
MATASGIIPLFPYLQQQQAQQRRTQDQERRAREERRNKRNAEYARRSRERKKLEQTALEQELRELQRENAFLRRTVKENLPDKNAQKILHRRDDLHRSDFELLESVAATRQSYCISDPRLPDNPIVYVSDAFCLLTGYSREQVIGRNCRILQGPETNPKAVEVLREAIQQGTDCTTVILNYKADGTPFWNRIFVAALRDKNRNIINYVGVQCEQDELDDAPSRAKRQKTDPNSRPSLPVVVRRDPLPVVPSSSLEAVKNRPQMSFNEDDFALTENLDWALLAQALEDDLPEDLSIDNLSFEESSRSSPLPDNFLVPSMSLVGDHEIPSSDLVPTQSFHNSYLDRFAATPLEIISRTVRGTVIGTLLNSHGDVKDKHFDAALSVLSKLYSSLGHNASPTNLYTGTWRELNRPHYRECLGQNKHGDFMYSLGRMSFDMFKPGKLKCSVQRTLNHIELVCELDGAPSAAPWSLRRELAAWDPSNDDDQKDTSSRANTLLKSYEYVLCLLKGLLSLPFILTVPFFLSLSIDRSIAASPLHSQWNQMGSSLFEH